MSDVIVETRDLGKRYGRVIALEDCSLAVRRGEVFGLLAPNGSGKSTLLRLLMGFLRPTSGAAWIDGLDCYRQSVAVHERVTYLPGDTRLFRQMRCRDVLAFFAGIRSNGSLRRALDLADRLHLNLDRQVATFSTGMRQKLALAIALSVPAPLVMLDEPTANLDPTVRQVVLALAREAQLQGATIIFSSHVLDEVEEICDRVAILRDGRLVHCQVMADLRLQHRIRARLKAPLPPIPESLAEGIAIEARNGDVMIHTPGELSRLLGWLATLPLAEVRIEPFGLRAVYDRYHSSKAS